jgi:hypothetical protein
VIYDKYRGKNTRPQCVKIQLYAELYAPRATGSLAVAVKPKAKDILRETAIFLFYSPQKYYLIKVARFSKMYYHTPFKYPKISGADVVKFQIFARLACRYWNGGVLQWHVEVKLFVKIDHLISLLNFPAYKDG